MHGNAMFVYHTVQCISFTLNVIKAVLRSEAKLTLIRFQLPVHTCTAFSVICVHVFASWCEDMFVYCDWFWTRTCVTCYLCPKQSSKLRPLQPQGKTGSSHCIKDPGPLHRCEVIVLSGHAHWSLQCKKYITY